jgi:hypothetical protein
MLRFLTMLFFFPASFSLDPIGVRSVVREALVKRHSDFEMDIGDIFQAFKAGM